jgi:hypothetical protein
MPKVRPNPDGFLWLHVRMPAMRIEYGDDPYSVTYEDEDDFEDFEPEYEDERDQIDRRDSDG